MAFFQSQQEYDAYRYRRELKDDVSKLGVLLLTFFVAQQLLGWIADTVLKDVSDETLYKSSTTMGLLLNGVLSVLIFFVIGEIYCAVRRLDLARLFPFERVGAGMLVMLCTVGLTLSLLSNAAMQAVTDVFALFGITNRGGEITGTGARPSIPIYYITVALLPALTEEFAFRGIVMGSLRRHSDALALVISSAAFALMHGNFVQMPFTFCCGLVFGFVAIKTDSLLPCIIIHFLNNAISITNDVLIMYGVVSGTVCNILFYALVLVLCVISIFLIRRIIREKPNMFRFDDSDLRLPYRVKMKTAVFSPTMLGFAAVMMLYSVYILFLPYLR